MMPAFPGRWPRQFLSAAALIVIIAALAFWPARHVLDPLWPGVAGETLVLDASGEPVRILHAGRHPPDQVGRLLRHERPSSLLAVEMRDGRRFFVFLAGVRPHAQARVASRMPGWTQPDRLVPPRGSSEVLVFETASGSPIDLPVAAIRRLYRPNRLSLIARAQLAWSRYREAAAHVDGAGWAKRLRFNREPEQTP